MKRLIVFIWLFAASNLWPQQEVTYETFADFPAGTWNYGWWFGMPEMVALYDVGDQIDTLSEMSFSVYRFEPHPFQPGDPKYSVFGDNFGVKMLRTDEGVLRADNNGEDWRFLHNDSFAVFQVFQVNDPFTTSSLAIQATFSTSNFEGDNSGVTSWVNEDTVAAFKVRSSTESNTIQITGTVKVKTDSFNYVWNVFEDRADADASFIEYNGSVFTGTKLIEPQNTAIYRDPHFGGTQAPDQRWFDGRLACVFVFDNEHFPDAEMRQNFLETAQLTYGDSLLIFPEGVFFGGEGEEDGDGGTISGKFGETAKQKYGNRKKRFGSQ